jgi:hypothetical protein
VAKPTKIEDEEEWNQVGEKKEPRKDKIYN